MNFEGNDILLQLSLCDKVNIIFLSQNLKTARQTQALYLYYNVYDEIDLLCGKIRSVIFNCQGGASLNLRTLVFV